MKRIKQRSGLIVLLALSALLLAPSWAQADDHKQSRPNIILMMADDLGWGDTGYNGHPVLKTPHLDAMAKEGIRFNRFYAAAPVCSPTRGSCLTGRHPYRYGIPHANTGHMIPEELTLAELMNEVGYRTGHFGKWHLGTLTKTVKDGNRGGPKNPELYSPPWENGFQVCFSTESKVPTWNPMFYENGKPYGTHYWSGPDQIVKDNLEGDDSRVIMDRVIPFVDKAAKDDTPFFAVVWFHTPHLPVVAGPKYLEMYKDEPGERPHYYGCITAMDEQIGRLRAALDKAGVADNTMVYFASDNGPEGGKETNKRPGSAGDLRGRKRSLYEGGIRVPGLMVWPARYDKPKVVDVPFNTSDYLPTVLDVLGIEKVDSRGPFDGLSMLPVLDGKRDKRGEGMGFRSQSQTAWISDRYKLIRTKNNKPYALYDLTVDRSEKNDLGQDHAAYAPLKADLDRWLKTLEGS